MRILLIIFDGLGDRPAAELDGQTPLEAARTPQLDRLAHEGITGLMHAKSPGYALGSPLALHLMFGYPEALFPDRGSLLARAREVAVGEGAVVLAARMASTVAEGGRLRLVERFLSGREEACEALAASIEQATFGGFGFRYVYTGRGDGLLLIGDGASYEVTDSDPLALELPVLRAQARADAADPALAARTAEALNQWTAWTYRQALGLGVSAPSDGPPVNCVISKWAGRMPSYEPFVERWGMRAASLPDEEVVSGLMLELGFHLVVIAGEEPEVDLRRRLESARELLDEGYEFVHLHTKYPDPISHRNDPLGSRDAIEALDRAMAWYWDELAGDPELITVLTTDHTTPSVWVGHPRGVFNDQHSGEPGPMVVRGGNVRVDAVTAFGERPVAVGGLGQLRGADFMPVLLNAAERTNMYEMRPTPVHRPYRIKPEELEALELPPD